MFERIDTLAHEALHSKQRRGISGKTVASRGMANLRRIQKTGWGEYVRTDVASEFEGAVVGRVAVLEAWRSMARAGKAVGAKNQAYLARIFATPLASDIAKMSDKQIHVQARILAMKYFAGRSEKIPPRAKGESMSQYRQRAIRAKTIFEGYSIGAKSEHSLSSTLLEQRQKEK